MLKKFNISTKKDDVYEITADVKQAVGGIWRERGNLCGIYSSHDCGYCGDLRMDPDGFEISVTR